MKKNKISILTVCMFSTFFTYAQVTKCSIGIEAGPTLRNLRLNDVIDNYNKTTLGYSGAISFQYNFNEFIALHTAIGYEKKGTKTKASIVDFSGNVLEVDDATRNLKYITLPVMLRASFGKKIKFFINAGPYFSYLLEEKDKIKTSEGIWNLTYTKNDKRFDGGVSAGAGGMLPVGNRFSFSLEVRSNLGLSDVNKNKTTNYGAVKNNTTNFLVGFVYNFPAISSNNDED